MNINLINLHPLMQMNLLMKLEILKLIKKSLNLGNSPQSENLLYELVSIAPSDITFINCKLYGQSNYCTNLTNLNTKCDKVSTLISAQKYLQIYEKNFNHLVLKYIPHLEYIGTLHYKTCSWYDDNMFNSVSTLCQNCVNNKLNGLSLNLFKNLTTIGEDFMKNLDIKVINLEMFNRVTKIGKNFLNNCKIVSINLHGLKNVTFIGDLFLANNQIEYLDLSPLKSLKIFGKYCFYNCNISHVNLDILSSLECTGFGFLSTNKLTNITLPKLNTNLIIEKKFIENNLIESLDLSELYNLELKPRMFLHNNPLLQESLQELYNILLLENP